jgi:hypothetical protein
MKSKDVIAKLLELDPTGEIEVLVGTTQDIDYINKLDGYWDGTPHLAIKDNTLYGYKTVGVNITRAMKDKICLYPLDTYELIFDTPDVPIYYEGKPSNLEHLEKFREAAKNDDFDFLELVESIQDLEHKLKGYLAKGKRSD